MALILFSRLYLGVHCALDLVGGLFAGGVALLAEPLLAGLVEAPLPPLAAGAATLGLFLMQYALFADTRPDNSVFDEAVQMAALLAGAVLGGPSAGWGLAGDARGVAEKILAFGAGMLALGLFRTVLSTMSRRVARAVLPQWAVVEVLRSFAVTAAVSYFVVCYPPHRWVARWP